MKSLKLVVVIEQDNDDIDQLNHVGLGIMDDIMSIPKEAGLKFSSATITDEDDHLVTRSDMDETISRDRDGEVSAYVHTGRHRVTFRKEWDHPDAETV
jgi:hypothetical protein